jgi:hypothetical protein
LLADNVSRAQDFISDYVARKIEHICKFFPLDVIRLDVEGIIHEKEEVILRVLRDVIKMCGDHTYTSRQKSLMRLYELLLGSYSASKQFSITVGGCIIWYEKKILVFKKEKCHKSIKTIPKNTIKSIIFFLEGKNSKYEAKNQTLNEAFSEMVESIPRPHKAFYGESFNDMQVGSKFVRIFPSLGIIEK